MTILDEVYAEAAHSAQMDRALNAPVEGRGVRGDTVRCFLSALLTTLWDEDEGFSGKRPFGNSDWKHDVYEALVKAGVVDGDLDEDGYLDHADYDAADQLIQDAIKHVFEAVK